MAARFQVAMKPTHHLMMTSFGETRDADADADADQMRRLLRMIGNSRTSIPRSYRLDRGYFVILARSDSMMIRARKVEYFSGEGDGVASSTLSF